MRQRRLTAGQTVGPLAWRAVDGVPVRIPDPAGRVVNLQFSRFAGCPVCNTHLAAYRLRAPELARAGVAVVVVFHSLAADATDLRGDLPFARRCARPWGAGPSACTAACSACRPSSCSTRPAASGPRTTAATRTTPSGSPTSSRSRRRRAEAVPRAGAAARAGGSQPLGL